jgi:hypothetical protein
MILLEQLRFLIDQLVVFFEYMMFFLELLRFSFEQLVIFYREVDDFI